ncbi:MAG: 3-dehydroquinate synthase [Chlamydiia bacterium]|nr:3-dehydroquinate synthase [Chlamydiia bacterium]MCH9618072.1 3-dehydroquinate synthase [Chlamydiia bacterium]MCH9624208.1 3-dehydroquinate synthase [Chlamydiia bacterium]
MISAKTREMEIFLEKVMERGHKVLLITDENVATIYASFLENLPFPYLVLSAGEKTKSREMKSFIEDYLCRGGYLKNTELIAFGGGVISDLVGFVSSTYMRGIPFSIIPTTIIGYVDASVGGKNGINTSYGKNLIGTFHFPQDVCLEKGFFKTLPKKLYEEQLSEVVKIALTSDRDLFFSMNDAIARARAIKLAIVQKDQKELGLRKILNFGHTFAHAYEMLMDYKVSHGKAVWKGIYFASCLSFHMGILPEKEWEVIKGRCKESYSDIDGEKLFTAMLMDKKNEGSTPMFVFLSEIGKVYQPEGKVIHAAEKQMVLKTLEALKKEGVCTVL